MPEQEGVIKFQLDHVPGSPLPGDQLRELIAWRRILFQLQLIGEDPLRYDGFGFGNISQLLPPYPTRSFAITGTQTGTQTELMPEHFSLVTSCDPTRNLVVSTGPVKPSSEAMTHATLYQIDADLRCVMHVHSPHIWRRAAALGLPITDPAAAYGTPAMTEAVRDVMALAQTSELGLFVMGGHEDGVVSFGKSVETAGLVLVRTLAQAYLGPQ